MHSPEAGAGLRQGKVEAIHVSERMIAGTQLEEALAPIPPGGEV